MSGTPADDAYTVSLVTRDIPGVLSRISLVFARRGFNIESLAVSPGAADGFARMTITSRGNPRVRDQIIKHLGKLIDVVYASDHSNDDPVEVESALIKVRCEGAERDRTIALAERYAAAIVDESEGRLIFAIQDESPAIDRFLSDLSQCNVEEVVRSGKIVIDRGASHFSHLLGGR